jgi:hypothetical protein
MSETYKQEEINKNGRDNKGRFIKGISGNPEGHNGRKDIAGLIEALEHESKKEGYGDFNKLVAKRAIQFETVLIAVLKKIYPDRIQGEGFADTTNVYNIIQQIQRDFQESRNSSMELDSGKRDGIYLGRTRQESGDKTIPEQAISENPV